MITREITEEEWELICVLRNYRRAYPNGNRMMIAEINDLVDELMDTQYWKEKEKEKEQKEDEGD